MSIHTTLLHAIIALGAVGSLMPGGSAPTPPTAPFPAVTSRAAPVGAPGIDALRRTWSWPLDPRPAVTARFVPPRSAYGAGHRGVDLAARPGQPVHSVAAGLVTHVGVVAGRGTVSIIHASGLSSTYEPVSGTVTPGAAVAEGQVIGHIEGRSHCGGSCLHLGARRGSGYVDPRPLLGGGPVILLPLGPGG